MGALDWPLIVSTLKEIGYDGALTVEFVAPLDRTPANPYKNAVAAAEQELTQEQLQFIQDHGSGVLSEEFYCWLVEETAKTLLPLASELTFWAIVCQEGIECYKLRDWRMGCDSYICVSFSLTRIAVRDTRMRVSSIVTLRRLEVDRKRQVW